MWFIFLELQWQPYVVPGCIVSFLVAGTWILLRRRRAGTRKAIAEALLIAGIGIYVSITLTPMKTMIWGQSLGQCGLFLLQPVGWHVFQVLDDRTLNVWLCVPAGFMAVMSKRMRPGWILACVCVPIIAETIQHFAPVLQHVCQAADVEDNWQGVLMGAVLGGAVLLARLLFRRSRKRLRPAAQPAESHLT